MRIFLAIDLPKNFFSTVQNYFNSWEEKNKNFRWVYKQNIHITLNFLGELDDFGISLLESVVEKSIENIAKFTFSTGSISYLPIGNYRRLDYNYTYRKELIQGLAFTINKGCKKIKLLSETIEENLASIGNQNSYKFRQKEKRPFIPHITIARKGKQRIGYYLNSIENLPYVVDGIADNITIVESEFSNNKIDSNDNIAKYKAIKVFKLGKNN